MSKLQDVINDLLADTPTAEINNAVNDLKLIIDKNINSELEEALAKYDIQNNVVYDGYVVAGYNIVEGGWFKDDVKGVKYQLDHLKRKISDTDESHESNSTCKEIHDEIIDYANEKFPSEISVNVGLKNGEDINITIVGSKTNAANFWNGRWCSKYQFFDGHTLSGEIHVDVHYYEDGNVRLKTKKFIEEVSVSSKDELVKAIKSLEDNLQKQLNRSFVELNEQQFKTLRRQLPVTRSKMEWGKAIGNYRLGKDATNA